MRREHAGAAVWAELEVAGADGRTKPELAANTGLTHCQVQAGLAFINHQLQETKKQPLAVEHEMTGRRGRPSHIHYLPDYWSEQALWSKKRLQDLLTRCRTEMTRARAAQARWPADVPQFLDHTLGGIERDIGYAISVIDSSTP